MSRLTQARGLKPLYPFSTGAAQSSRLTQARGLKRYDLFGYSIRGLSRLTQARGLKLAVEKDAPNSSRSRALRRRVD